ncbi:hypothetical protein AB0D57_19385 [Streptomyces sp. NPDC048275]|uniref:hypothetical protein n=1 Tax=Streptomyces sp. NPDC048275 TaxID=3155629 RepID=UPI0033E75F7D
MAETERSGDVFGLLCLSLLIANSGSYAALGVTRACPRPHGVGVTPTELPTEGAHAHGVTEAGGLGAPGLDAVAQLTRLGPLAEKLGASPPALGVRFLPFRRSWQSR